MKLPLVKEVGLGPGHIVLDGDPVGTQPLQQPLPTFGPCLLWPNGRQSQQLLSSCSYIRRRAVRGSARVFAAFVYHPYRVRFGGRN